MYKQSILIVALLFGFINSAAAQYDASDFTSEGRKFQPVPTGHTPGKDNGAGFGFHSAGEDCGVCHKPSGRAPNHVFTMAGTLYDDRAARKPTKGGEVILQDINGKVISMTSNEVGNFWTYEAIGGNPLTVVGKDAGFKMYSTNAEGTVVKYADASYPQTWQYKTWVKNGEHVLPMITIAPVGGATILDDGMPDPNSRMGCSMHHAPIGSRGALWASTKSTLKSYPSSGLSFKKHILPIFKNKCVPCHIPGGTMTRVVTKSDLDSPSTSMVDYSGNIDLTYYDGSSVETTDGTEGTKKGVKDVVGKILSITLMDNNSGSGPLTHAGGGFWKATDADYMALKQWITEGAQNN